MKMVLQNLYKRFLYSVRGFHGYKDLLKEAPGRAVVFVILLTTLLGLATLVGPAITINRMATTIVQGFDNKIPDFTLRDGQLQVSGKMPVIIDNTQGATIIVDTSDKPDETILENYDNATLVLKDRIILKSYADTQIISLSDITGMGLGGFTSLAMNKESLKLLIPLLQWMMVLFVLVGLPFFILEKFISALIISMIGLTVNSMTRAGLPYKDIYRISLYAMTLPLILCTLLDLFRPMPMVTSMLYFGLAGIYVAGAIRSIAGDKPKEEE